MEKIEVDNKDRPIEDIEIQAAQVFVDPFEEADEQLAKERQAEVERLAQEAKKTTTKNDGILKVYKSGIGKYINMDGNKKK